MNTNETKNENTVQKPCSNTSKSGANADKSRDFAVFFDYSETFKSGTK